MLIIDSLYQHRQLLEGEPVSEQEFNVLVIDDDKDVGYLFERLLGGPQKVSTATDGEQAIEQAQQKEYDLIFVDVRLPGMDGVETLKRLKDTTSAKRSKRPILPARRTLSPSPFAMSARS
jgi:CheY-like chemotaxis protein